MEFDVSQCAALLPCHVIGVRITDCWGNSELAQGALAEDGRTVRAHWEPMGGSGTVLQDNHWRVRLALCRGLGSKVPLSQVAAFDSLRMNAPHVEHTRHIGTQEVKLSYYGGAEGGGEQRKWMQFTTIKLPGAALDDWPVLVGFTGHLAGGGTEVFAPNKEGQETFLSQARPQRIFNSGHGPATPITTPTFEVRYSVPATYESVDLHFTIERPEVFQFDVQVSDWPSPSTK